MLVCIVRQMNYRVQCLLCRLTVLPVASLQVNCMLSLTQLRQHELRTRSAERTARFVAVSDHCVLVHPHDRPETLDVLGLLVGDEVTDKQTLPHRLRKPVVALSGACCGATCRTDSA